MGIGVRRSATHPKQWGLALGEYPEGSRLALPDAGFTGRAPPAEGARVATVGGAGRR